MRRRKGEGFLWYTFSRTKKFVPNVLEKYPYYTFEIILGTMGVLLNCTEYKSLYGGQSVTQSRRWARVRGRSEALRRNIRVPNSESTAHIHPQAKFERKFGNKRLHYKRPKLADQRHGPKTHASIPKSFARRMQWGCAAAGMEAAFPLPAAKCDSAKM